MPLNEAELEDRLLEAHARDDKAALAMLYLRAADMKEALQDIDAACFYLTNAYVFALVVGAPEARDMHRRLKDRGREE